jgi:hypothetical protein
MSTLDFVLWMDKVQDDWIMWVCDVIMYTGIINLKMSSFGETLDFNYYIVIWFSIYPCIIILLIEEFIIYLLYESNEWFDGVEDVYS